MIPLFPNKKTAAFAAVLARSALALPLGELSCASMTERVYRIFAKQIFDISGFSKKIRRPLRPADAGHLSHRERQGPFSIRCRERHTGRSLHSRYIRLLSSSVKLPLVETMELSPSSGGGPPKTLTTSPPASRRISQPAAMSQGLVPNSNWPSARPQAM